MIKFNSNLLMVRKLPAITREESSLAVPWDFEEK